SSCTAPSDKHAKAHRASPRGIHGRPGGQSAGGAAYSRSRATATAHQLSRRPMSARPPGPVSAAATFATDVIVEPFASAESRAPPRTGGASNAERHPAGGGPGGVRRSQLVCLSDPEPAWALGERRPLSTGSGCDGQAARAEGLVRTPLPPYGRDRRAADAAHA